MKQTIQKSNRGFTLISLLIAIVIMGIMLAIGIPSFQSTALSSTLGSYTNKLIAGTQLARSEAMKRNTVIRMCPSANGTTCTTGNWNQGWIVYVQGTGEVLHRQQELDSNYIIDSTVDNIDFQPTGIGASQANITLCRSAPSAGDYENLLTVSATGRTLLSKTTTGICTI